MSKKKKKVRRKKSEWDALSEHLSAYVKHLEKDGYNEDAAKRLRKAISGFEGTLTQE